MSDAVEKYIEYVQEKIKEMQEISDLIRDGQIIPSRLHWAMSQYVDVALGLQMEYQRLKTEHKALSKAFQVWWDKKILESRDALRLTRTASASLSMKEIEAQARTDNAISYSDKTDEIDSLEERIDFIRSIMKIWEKEDNLLVTLSHNMRSEMRSLSIVDRANAQPKQYESKSTNRRRMIDEDD